MQTKVQRAANPRIYRLGLREQAEMAGVTSLPDLSVLSLGSWPSTDSLDGWQPPLQDRERTGSQVGEPWIVTLVMPH